LQDELCTFFTVDLPALCQKEGWDRDSQWTDAIQQYMARLGHRYGYRVCASQSRCPTADGPEWLYDHHWRVVTDDGYLFRIPLAMEIEWGFGVSTIFDRVREDYLKLIQARADLRILVFQGTRINEMTDRLINLAESFEGVQQGDQYLFAGWDWDTEQMNCTQWSA
jgi:hypothetical protein